MRARFTTAVLLGFVLVGAAACGGGNDQATIDELEAELAASEEAREEAEEKAAEAESKRLEEEAAREQAEEERLAAGRGPAGGRRAAPGRRRGPAGGRRAAPGRRSGRAQRLAAEAEKARKAADTERARVAISGDRNIGTTDPPGLVASNTFVYGEPAPVTAPPGPFTTTTGRSGRWSTTLLTDRREATRHTIEIYSDVEAPKNEPFRTSPLNMGSDVGPTGTSAVIDGTGDVVGWVNIMNASGSGDGHSRIAASGSFPRNIGNPEQFDLRDRGLTETEYGTGPERYRWKWINLRHRIGSFYSVHHETAVQSIQQGNGVPRCRRFPPALRLYNERSIAGSRRHVSLRR